MGRDLALHRLAPRMNQLKDLAAALEFLGRTGKVDASRAALMGGRAIRQPSTPASL